MVGNRYVTVCVQDAADLKRLARLGRQIADQTGCMLKVMLLTEMNARCEEQAETLEYAFQCAKNMDAEMNVYYTDRPLDRLMRDSSHCLVVSGEEELTGQLREIMPEKRLVVME